MYVNLALAYYEQGDYPKSEMLLNKALENEDYLYLVHYNYSKILLKQNKIDEALKHILKSIQLNNKFDEAYIQRGYICQKLEGDKNAIQWYKTAISVNDTNATANYQLGLAYNRIEEYDSSLKYINLSIKYNIDRELAYKIRCDLKFRKKDYLGMISDMKIALKYNNSDTFNLVKLGAVYEANNIKDSACYYFKKAAELGSKDAERIIEESCK